MKIKPNDLTQQKTEAKLDSSYCYNELTGSLVKTKFFISNSKLRVVKHFFQKGSDHASLGLGKKQNKTRALFFCCQNLYLTESQPSTVSELT